jgi:hypothetical protein
LVLCSIVEVHSVDVIQGNLSHHAETEVPLQNEAVREKGLHLDQMPHHLYWISLKSLHQGFRKVVLIENLMELRATRGLMDHDSRVLEGPLDKVKIILFLYILPMKDRACWLCSPHL